jgi:tripeptide aminopeptidase
MKPLEHLLDYVRFDTQSDHDSTTYPSTAKQLLLLDHLCAQLKALGLPATRDEFGYVIAVLPANTTQKVAKIALVAHVDTSPDASGANIKPRLISNYDGSVIVLNETKGIRLDPAVFASLKRHLGKDLLVTDGTTLLGADDKAGVAIIMSLIEYLLANPTVLHGQITVVFTPDEEVGQGTDYLDLTKVDADYGYTLDGSAAGEIAFENFNAASAVLHFNGKSVHPGSAKHKMVNAIRLAFEFDRLLPVFDRPEHTEGYEGFNHINRIEGLTEKAKAEYIIRNHDRVQFAKQKRDFEQAAQFLNQRYGEGTCELEIKDSYFNMREKLVDKMHIVEHAIDAIRAEGLTPIIEPIRGGTDGARLTYLGLPCPNLGTGGYGFHGPYEYVCVQELDKALEILKRIVTKIAQ